MKLVDLSKLYDEPLDPAGMDFTTKEKRAGNCCLFRKQRMMTKEGV